MTFWLVAPTVIAMIGVLLLFVDNRSLRQRIEALEAGPQISTFTLSSAHLYSIGSVLRVGTDAYIVIGVEGRRIHAIRRSPL